MKIAFREAPLFAFHSLFNSVKNRVAVYWERVVMLGFIIAAVEQHKPFRGVFWLILSTLIVLILTEQVYVQWIENKIQPKAEEKIYRRLRQILYEKAVSMDISCYDDPDFFNDFVWAMSEASKRVGKVFESVSMLLAALAGLLLSVAYMASHDWVGILIITLAMIASYFLNKLIIRLRLKLAEKMKPHERRRDYIARVFYLADHAKEIRLNNVKGRLYKDFNDSVKQLENEAKLHTRKIAFLDAVIGFCIYDLPIQGIYLLYLLYKTIVKHVFAYSELVMLFNAAQMTFWSFSDITEAIPQFQENSLYIEKIHNFLSRQTIVTSPENPLEIPECFESLTLRNVSFSYKGELVLKNINLTIKSSERIALVGYNGAGKTTLVKLLMRLYDPDEGEILYNGMDIRSFDLEQYRKKFSTVFQDYQLFAANVLENIVTDTAQVNMIKLKNSLEASGFSEKLSELKDGLETMLTREFDDNGTQLSGGEAQSLAIARALYRDAQIMILDEPSSALDPIAEYRLNRQMMEQNREKTILMISHRLSTTRLADRIIMLENGEIIDMGSHSQLMESCGKYAQMFNLQAEKYRMTS